MGQLVRNVLGDLQVLKSIWFAKIQGDSHKERLESFYAPQAEHYDSFRARFLHGRNDLLAACADRMDELEGRTNLVWVDLGGGTGENVDMMSEYFDLAKFKKIYVVDICGPLCDIARKRVIKRGWDNVEVVEADVCDFEPEVRPATLITFSYSLSMIPPFMTAVDTALSYLEPAVGILGVADFYTSLRFDIPERQQWYVTRWFWRCIFDLDNIDLSPERRVYLDHLLQRGLFSCKWISDDKRSDFFSYDELTTTTLVCAVYEDNHSGSIPYVPLLRAPYYIWLGKKKQTLAINGN